MFWTPPPEKNSYLRPCRRVSIWVVLKITLSYANGPSAPATPRRGQQVESNMSKAPLSTCCPCSTVAFNLSPKIEHVQFFWPVAKTAKIVRIVAFHISKELSARMLPCCCGRALRPVFWTAGEQNGQAGFRDRLAFAGLVLTMYVVITVRSDDNVTTTISCNSRH